MSLSKEEHDILKSCYELMREIEKNSKDENFSETDLFNLAGLLSSFANSNNQNLYKLSLIPGHLHPQMPMRHFLNFLVPLERLIQRNLSDEAFLITTLDRQDRDIEKVPLYFVLENIRSAFNVGSIFRLADCIGVEEIYLCGYTPSPPQDALEKTSLGTTNAVAWRHFNHIDEALEDLLKKNVQLLALETTKTSTSIFQLQVRGPSAFIVGNERFGLEASALSKCHQVISIPTFGIKNSLNVSNALSIAGYEWRRQWK
jgi:tRNA(Leu) C34 or U34 (ribose-2'-O)-methylase TrmL